ncbi:MAG: cytochrome c-type biogenesis protein [Myxococcota bacterium]
MRAFIFTAALALALPAAAQESETVKTETVVEVERTSDRAIALGKKIRCPVCQGTPISESPSTSAQDMMKQLRRLIDEGMSDEEIIEWFKARYGEWAILEPSREGFNLLVWVLPFVALLGGIVLWRMNISSEPVAAASEGPTSDAEEDPYRKALRDEVEA